MIVCSSENELAPQNAFMMQGVMIGDREQGQFRQISLKNTAMFLGLRRQLRE